MNDSRNDSRIDAENSKSNSDMVDTSRTERAVRASNISLVDQRRSARTLGFLGLSTVGHVAILVALASVPMAVHELNGGDGKPAGAGEVSIVEINDRPAVSAATIATKEAPVEVSVMTDSSSNIAISPAKLPEPEPEPKIEAAVAKLPEKKSVSKKSPTANKPIAKVAKSVVTEETQEAPPVLLANPPGDDEQRAETAPVEAMPIAAEPEQAPEPKEEAVAVVQPQTEPTQEPDAVAVATTASPVERSKPESPSTVSEEQSSSTAAPAVAQKLSGPAAGHGGQEQNGNTGAIAGPIRDASELKALGGNPNPVYPARDRLEHKEGTAVILGRVSPDGRIVEATLERSSGSARMDAASIQAFRGWRFQAGQQGWVRKPFQFRLVGEAKEVPAPLGKGLKR